MLYSKWVDVFKNVFIITPDSVLYSKLHISIHKICLSNETLKYDKHCLKH